MRGNILPLITIAGFTVLLAGIAFANVPPPPPANQQLGIKDSVYSNLEEAY